MDSKYTSVSKDVLQESTESLKSKWIRSWTTGDYTNTNHEVISFIADILFHSDIDAGSEAVYNLFACGYCYYFACMLKEAFGRGKVMWHYHHSHVVWLDDNGVAYEIGGVFEDYEEGDLVPVESLGFKIKLFKHI